MKNAAVTFKGKEEKMAKRREGEDKDRSPRHFGEEFPEIYEAYDQLVKKCHEKGPLDQKTRQLIKIAVASASYLENTVKANTARAIRMGITREEIEQAILITMPMVGYPKMVAALGWCRQAIGGQLFR